MSLLIDHLKIGLTKLLRSGQNGNAACFCNGIVVAIADVQTFAPMAIPVCGIENKTGGFTRRRKLYDIDMMLVEELTEHDFNHIQRKVELIWSCQRKPGLKHGNG